MPDRAEYVAKRTLYVNGVRSANEGDPVPAGTAEIQGWVVGEDIEPSGLALMPMPAKNAKRTEWVVYARDQGADEEKVDGMTREQLVNEFGEQDTGVDQKQHDAS